jgi:hypothetical protein
MRTTKPPSPAAHWPPPNSPLPCLIQKSVPRPNAASKRNAQPDATRAQNTLQLRDMEPENSADERELDGGEELEVLRRFVEGWWVLKDA